MFEGDRAEATVSSGAGRGEQRRVAFADSDDVFELAFEGEQFAVAPDAALVERGVAHAALAPKGLQTRGIESFRRGGFEQTAAFRAVVDDVRDGILRAAAAIETNQMGGHEFLIILGLLCSLFTWKAAW